MIKFLYSKKNYITCKMAKNTILLRRWKKSNVNKGMQIKEGKMDILSIAILIFCIMETANVFILYFWPDSRLGNGVAVFDNWNDAKKDESSDLFAHYMTYWVAGTKLIFIVLLLVVLFTGTETTKVYAVGAMILSIATYFWKLHPIIKKLDEMGKITPKNYSKVLAIMILGFLIMFTGALIAYFVLQ